MQLAIDVGNTQVVIGLHDGVEWLQRWRVRTERARTSDEWASMLAGLFGLRGLRLADCSDISIGSVVPGAIAALRDMSLAYCGAEPFVVGPGVKTGVRILTDNPREVGADRVLNALAAHERYGGPAIVVDFGTATTVDVVSVQGDYLGGAIAPGLAISAEALQRYTARLQEVELVRPARMVGRNTVECMQIGIVIGYAGLVERLVAGVKAELGEAKVIATGGLVSAVAQATSAIDVIDEDLTLEGLRLMYELNRGRMAAGAAPVQAIGARG
ncbi:MAG: type III pantothenate kinase [Chloroflexota bacterium]|nr:type III pantothenate kinase [Chloroflexota bacterium]